LTLVFVENGNLGINVTNSLCLKFVLLFIGFAKEGIIIHGICNLKQIICLKRQFAKNLKIIFIKNYLAS
jgi:hypothetical protein